VNEQEMADIIKQYAESIIKLIESVPMTKIHSPEFKKILENKLDIVYTHGRIDQLKELKQEVIE